MLVACLGNKPKESWLEGLQGRGEETWEALLDAASQQEVVPLLYHTLKTGCDDPEVPEHLWEKMRRNYFNSAARNMRLCRELQKILSLFNSKEIPVIVLKGAHLSETVYGNIALRGMCDVDLLVKKEDLASVAAELLALGSVPKHHNHVFSQSQCHFGYQLQSGLVVEIHWSIISLNSPCRVDVEGLWERARPMTLAQVPVLTLSPEDLLLHLCLHTAKHSHDMHIRMLYDIREAARYWGTELDWQAMGARARQWGMVRPAYVFLRLARELLEAPVPEDWLASMGPSGFDERYLLAAREQFFSAANDLERSVRQAANLWGTKGLGRKLALIGGTLLLSRESMANMYPVPVNSWRIYLYYPVRLKDVLLRHGRSFWRLVCADPQAQNAARGANKDTALNKWLMSG